MTTLRDRKTLLFQYIAAAILALALFPGRALAEQSGKPALLKEISGVKHDMFNIEEILDESTLDIKILKDWHVDEVTGSTRQKLIEINVAEWWPGQDYRIPVRMIVPLKGKAKGFNITGANPYEGLMTDVETNRLSGKTAGQWSWRRQDCCQVAKANPGKTGPGTRDGDNCF